MSDDSNSQSRPDEPQREPGRAPKRPEFGELAPEGWVNPVTGKAAGEPEPTSGGTELAHRDAANEPENSVSAVTDLSGIPRNLGVGIPRNADVTQTGKEATPESSQSPAGESQPQPSSRAALTQRSANTSERTVPTASIRIDRIATILLLAAGALGSLNVADSFMQLPTLFAQLYALFEIGSFTAPQWFVVVSTLGWVSQLLIFALAMLMSVQRMRAQKFAFYIPLAAALISGVVTVALMGIALSAAPELVTYLSTNGFSLEQLQELQ